MNIKIRMKTRDGAAFADGIYTGDNVIVLPGGKISAIFRGGKMARKIRENPEYISSEGKILKECNFKSASTAAQFVNGNICNGFRVWKVGKEELGAYLKKNGIDH